ncbi:peptidylprolyl isomerase [Sphingomonas vulcanisoli]|uniref:peptidylprolyl isomerase n=1 Tax=Sphingomonas vulcanisoli TaxID=1658060 RepID=A0ABX0TU50_9SPHN|nr:peptidylprolyl isomerase [Sphingomonas vulcanisoli]NIJ09043.1 peptidylprolyl isomerase [Sphingomonas vulcanisoli]
MIRSLTPALALLVATAALAADPPKPATPASVLERAPAGDWAPVPLDHLMVMELAGGGRVAILLAPEFAPGHVGNIEAMAKAHWYDGLWIDRVQDGYVTQWGDPDDKKPLPPGAVEKLPAEYERPVAGLAFKALPYRDTFAPQVGLVGPWPVARDGATAWLTHCYGMVGVGRSNSPDNGNGMELYTIIAQPARQLDRNITVVGRVLWGMEHLTALPRGQGAMGFYDAKVKMLPIVRVTMANELPASDRPHLEMLRSDSASFDAWVHIKANRKDDFYVRPAGAIDLCSALPPVREIK